MAPIPLKVFSIDVELKLEDLAKIYSKWIAIYNMPGTIVVGMKTEVELIINAIEEMTVRRRTVELKSEIARKEIEQRMKLSSLW